MEEFVLSRNKNANIKSAIKDKSIGRNHISVLYTSLGQRLSASSTKTVKSKAFNNRYNKRI